MICSIHQPSYFPWLGFLDKVAQSDVFVILDNVQLNDAVYQHRNLFLDNQKNTCFLTIPINKKNYQKKTIKDITIASQIWQKKHRKFLYYNYKKHPHFDEVFPLIEVVFQKEYKYLIDVLLDTMYISFEAFSITAEIVFASDLKLKQSYKEDLVIDILKAVEANEYLSGQGAKSYQNEQNFKSENLKLHYQKFQHPNYEQFNNDNFVEGLSCLDFLFNNGFNKQAFIED